jgi:hypothetical protein
VDSSKARGAVNRITAVRRQDAKLQQQTRRVVSGRSNGGICLMEQGRWKADGKKGRRIRWHNIQECAVVMMGLLVGELG